MLTLGPGNALRFPSTLAHQWRNDSAEPVTALWVNAPLVEFAAGMGNRHPSRRRDAHGPGRTR